MKFTIKEFFSKCDQIRSFLRISSHLLKKSLMENFIFWEVHDKNDFQISELPLFGVSSNNDASYTCILNATIQYILATKRFDVPLTIEVVWKIHIFEYIC